VSQWKANLQFVPTQHGLDARHTYSCHPSTSSGSGSAFLIIARPPAVSSPAALAAAAAAAAAASLWGELALTLKMHLWVSSCDDAGLARLLLVQEYLGASPLNKPRSFFVKHFARAANMAFAQVRDAACIHLTAGGPIAVCTVPHRSCECDVQIATL
jgi:hypothetical protein